MPAPENKTVISKKEGAGIRVLIAEDDQHIRFTTGELLKHAGFIVDAAQNGSEALELISKRDYDIVLTDYMMPDLNGIELIKVIKTIKPEMAFIMMTAHMDINIAIGALHEEVFDFLLKPVDFDKLKATIRKAVAEKEEKRDKDRLIDELRSMSQTDVLTGLNNRGYFESIYKVEMDRSRRYGRPLSCIMIDIDHFKKVNDTFGHKAGDAILKSVAAVLAKNLRSVDAFTLCRWGGEEFVVLLPETNLDGAAVCAEHLRKAVEEENTRAEGSVIRITISCGVSSSSGGTSAGAESDLLYHADMALLESKKNGRNRITLHRSAAAG